MIIKTVKSNNCCTSPEGYSIVNVHIVEETDKAARVQVTSGYVIGKDYYLWIPKSLCVYVEDAIYHHQLHVKAWFVGENIDFFNI